MLSVGMGPLVSSDLSRQELPGNASRTSFVTTEGFALGGNCGCRKDIITLCMETLCFDMEQFCFNTYCMISPFSHRIDPVLNSHNEIPDRSEVEGRSTDWPASGTLATRRQFCQLIASDMYSPPLNTITADPTPRSISALYSIHLNLSAQPFIPAHACVHCIYHGQ
jgi:hypothetical protein